MHFVSNAWKMNASGSLEPICNLFETIMIFITINNNNYNPRHRALTQFMNCFFCECSFNFMFSHDYNELQRKKMLFFHRIIYTFNRIALLLHCDETRWSETRGKELKKRIPCSPKLILLSDAQMYQIVWKCFNKSTLM